MAKLTGWGLNDILDQEVGDLDEWLKSAQEVENEINKQMKRK